MYSLDRKLDKLLFNRAVVKKREYNKEYKEKGKKKKKKGKRKQTEKT